MSLESAKAFLKKMKTEEAFAAKVSEIKSKEERIQFARESGFDFSAEEIKEVSSELDDDDLDQIAGGAGLQIECKVCIVDFSGMAAIPQ